jgi:hypothetical protein
VIAPFLVKTENVAKGDQQSEKSSAHLTFFLTDGLPLFSATSGVFTVYSHPVSSGGGRWAARMMIFLLRAGEISIIQLFSKTNEQVERVGRFPIPPVAGHP